MIAFSGSVYCAVSGPCGHVVEMDDAWEARDRFACPVCGLRWRVDQSPPTVYDSGFIMPGKRIVRIQPQPNLPTQTK